MINLQKLVMLMRQTKFIPNADINKVRVIVKKMNKGQKVTVAQRAFFNDLSRKLMIPILDTGPLYMMTKKTLKKIQQKKEKAAKA